MTKYITILTCLMILNFSLRADEVPPNVLLITADDMSWDSLGCTGNLLPGLSPNIDKLAAEGFLIETCHIATPICGSSRQALYTGQLPQTSGYMGHGIQPPKWWRAEGRTVSKKSIASDLYNNGYFTGNVGKHGSSWCKFSVPPFGKNSQTGMGRDPEKYYAFVREFLDRAKKEAKPFYLAANAHDPHRYWARHPSETSKWIDVMMGSEPWTPLANGKPYPDPKTRFNPTDCPVPASYPNDLRLKNSLAHYYDSVNRMDQVVGGVLRALDESGMAENTIVIFLSDHGLAWQLSKWSLYPSGTKTPVIVRWPGRVEPGRRDEKSVLSVVDIAPTIADICGLPTMEKIDGKSFRCLLEGNGKEWQRTEAFSCFNYMNNEKKYDQVVDEFHSNLHREVDQYRASRALSSEQFTYIWNGWADGTTKLPRTMGGEVTGLLRKAANNPEDTAYPDYSERANFIEFRIPEEMYDTNRDPGCRNNLAKNPEYATMIEGFRQRMGEFLKRSNDHELENYQSFTHGQ